MTFLEYLAWINTNIITPIFNFQLSFAGGVAFGGLVVAIFGLPLLVKSYKKFF